MAPSIVPLIAVQLSCPLQKSRTKNTPKAEGSTSMFWWWGCHLVNVGSWQYSSSPNRWVELMPKSWIFRLQTCAFWAGGTLRLLAGFQVLHGRSVLPIVSWWLWSQLPWDHWHDPPVSSGLIHHCSHDHWNSTRWDLAWSPSPREIDSYFVFLLFANNRKQLLSPSHQAACWWSCSPFQPCVGLQSWYPWHPESSLVLAMMESLESDWLIDYWFLLWTGCLLFRYITETPFTRVHLISAPYLYKNTWEPESLLIDRGSNTYWIIKMQINL